MIFRAAGKLLYVALISFAGTIAANAQQFQTFKDCVVGKRVSTNNGRKGVITRLDVPWSHCYVRFDDTSKEESLLYSLLNADDSGKKSDSKLVAGVYECVTGGQYTTMILRLTSPTSYSTTSGPGAVRIESTGRIVFETGPLKSFSSKLLSGCQQSSENVVFRTAAGF